MWVVGTPADRADPGRARLRARTAIAFEEFFDAERVRLFKALFAMTGNRQEAEDIAQEAFLRLWERWDDVASMDEPAGYLHRTAMNVYRDRRRRFMLGLRRAVHLSSAPDDYETVEARSVAATVLGTLPPRQRAAIVLTEGLGYSAEEAGAILRIKGSTVRALLFQARASLKGILERSDD